MSGDGAPADGHLGPTDRMPDKSLSPSESATSGVGDLLPPEMDSRGFAVAGVSALLVGVCYFLPTLWLTGDNEQFAAELRAGALIWAPFGFVIAISARLLLADVVGRWKRTAALVGCVVLAIIIALLISDGLNASNIKMNFLYYLTPALFFGMVPGRRWTRVLLYLPVPIALFFFWTGLRPADFASDNRYSPLAFAYLVASLGELLSVTLGIALAATIERGSPIFKLPFLLSARSADVDKGTSGGAIGGTSPSDTRLASLVLLALHFLVPFAVLPTFVHSTKIVLFINIVAVVLLVISTALFLALSRVLVKFTTFWSCMWVLLLASIIYWVSAALFFEHLYQVDLSGLSPGQLSGWMERETTKMLIHFLLVFDVCILIASKVTWRCSLAEAVRATILMIFLSWIGAFLAIKSLGALLTKMPM